MISLEAALEASAKEIEKHMKRPVGSIGDTTALPTAKALLIRAKNEIELERTRHAETLDEWRGKAWSFEGKARHLEQLLDLHRANAASVLRHWTAFWLPKKLKAAINRALNDHQE